MVAADAGRAPVAVAMRWLIQEARPVAVGVPFIAERSRAGVRLKGRGAAGWNKVNDAGNAGASAVPAPPPHRRLRRTGASAAPAPLVETSGCYAQVRRGALIERLYSRCEPAWAGLAYQAAVLNRRRGAPHSRCEPAWAGLAYQAAVLNRRRGALHSRCEPAWTGLAYQAAVLNRRRRLGRMVVRRRDDF